MFCTDILLQNVHSKLKPQLHSQDSGYDSSRFEPDGKIGVHQDASGGKKKNQHQYGASPCSYGVTDPLRLMTAALRFNTVELQRLTMPPRFNTVLVRFKLVALR